MDRDFWFVSSVLIGVRPWFSYFGGDSTTSVPIKRRIADAAVLSGRLSVSTIRLWLWPGTTTSSLGTWLRFRAWWSNWDWRWRGLDSPCAYRMRKRGAEGVTHCTGDASVLQLSVGSPHRNRAS